MRRLYTIAGVFLYFLFCQSVAANAQSFVGYQTTSYAGVYGTLFNPANILDHRVRADVNLIGFSLAAENNMIKIERGNKDNAVQVPFPITKTGRASLQYDMLGPSFMIRLSDKNAFAITTRFRAQMNADNVSAPVLNLSLQDAEKLNSFNHLPISLKNGTLQVHAWNELAFTYSRQIATSVMGVWKAAASLKFTGGQGAAYFSVNRLQFIYNDSLQADQNLQVKYGGAENATGNINLQYADFMDEWADKYKYHFFKQPGLAADIGVTYEYRDVMQVYETAYNENTLNYKWKAGASITDIGSIRYKASPNSASVHLHGQTFLFNDLAVPADSTTLQQIAGFYKTKFNGSSSAPTFTMALPTTLHFLFDYSFNKWFSADAHFSMPVILSPLAYYTGTHTLSVLTITPRAELPWIGIYMPLSYHFSAGFQMGGAIRLGPLVIGSASAITTGILGKGKGGDAYFILRIPFFGYHAYQSEDIPQRRTKFGRKSSACPKA